MSRDKLLKQGKDLADLRRSHAEMQQDRERAVRYNEELEKTLQSIKQINQDLKKVNDPSYVIAVKFLCACLLFLTRIGVPVYWKASVNSRLNAYFYGGEVVFSSSAKRKKFYWFLQIYEMFIFAKQKRV